jgi:hypothetical protein
LFGTVYDPGFAPGNEPENWGLYYDYPKDYFLQHAFSVKRFDEQKLLRFRWFRVYYTIRPKLISGITKLFSYHKKIKSSNGGYDAMANTSG